MSSLTSLLNLFSQNLPLSGLIVLFLVLLVFTLLLLLWLLRAGASPVEYRVTSVATYPVKSCGPIASASAKLVPGRGFENDRVFVVVELKADGSADVVTQRECRKLALVQPSISGGTLTLSMRLPGAPSAAPGGDTVSVSLTPVKGEKELSLELFRAKLDVADAGQAAASWLARSLPTTKNYRLMRILTPRDNARDDWRWGSCYFPQDVTGAHDGSQFLVTFGESLVALNAAMPAAGDAVPMESFRPNVVLEGGAAWGEDWVMGFTFSSGLRLRTNKGCQRCVLSTVDQSRGESRKSMQPLKQLKKTRAPADPRFNGGNSENPHSPLFGLNCSVNSAISGEAGVVSVGDKVVGEKAGGSMLTATPIERYLYKYEGGDEKKKEK